MLKPNWLIIGLTAFSLAACSPGRKSDAPKSGEAVIEDTHTAGHSEIGQLPIEKRVAFMAGHVQAGIALYRAGAPDQAAPHLLHPVSETHQAERAGIDALGFDQSIFIAVSEALEAGKPASEIQPQLRAAEANLAKMQRKAGGDPAEIIRFLMDTVVEEYAIGVNKGEITDPGEYQDAYGFTIIAVRLAKRMDNPKNKELRQALARLKNTWPKTGPLADSKPKSVPAVKKRVAEVLAQLD